MEVLSDELRRLHLTLINDLFNDVDESTVIKYKDNIKLGKIANILEDTNKYLEVSLWATTMG